MVAAVHENNVTTDGIVTYCPGLKLLLTKKPKLDHQDIKGCVPLIQAINLNRPYAVKLLVSVISFFLLFFLLFLCPKLFTKSDAVLDFSFSFWLVPIQIVLGQQNK